MSVILFIALFTATPTSGARNSFESLPVSGESDDEADTPSTPSTPKNIDSRPSPPGTPSTHTPPSTPRTLGSPWTSDSESDSDQEWVRVPRQFKPNPEIDLKSATHVFIDGNNCLHQEWEHQVNPLKDNPSRAYGLGKFMKAEKHFVAALESFKRRSREDISWTVAPEVAFDGRAHNDAQLLLSKIKEADKKVSDLKDREDFNITWSQDQFMRHSATADDTIEQLVKELVQNYFCYENCDTPRVLVVTDDGRGERKGEVSLRNRVKKASKSPQTGDQLLDVNFMKSGDFMKQLQLLELPSKRPVKHNK